MIVHLPDIFLLVLSASPVSNSLTGLSIYALPAPKSGLIAKRAHSNKPVFAE